MKINNPNSRDYHGISWKTTWIREGQTEENDISSGTLNCNNNSICEISINGSDNSGKAQPGVWQVYLGGATSPSCSMTLSDGNGLPPMKASNCKLNNGATQLAASQTAQFDANMTKCNGSACNWYIKKDGTKVSEGTFGDQLHQNITGPGIYTVHLLSESASAACTVTITEKSPASNCRHNSTNRSYGEGHQFQAKLTLYNGTTYRILGPNGEEIKTGTFNQTYNDQDWNSDQFPAKISGQYTLEIGGIEACKTSNSLNVSAAYMSNCSLDQTSISSGGSTNFKYKINNCKNNACSYEIKRSGVFFKKEDNKGEGDYSVSVNEGGEYVVWLNGSETDCKATLTVSSGSGSATCSMSKTDVGPGQDNIQWSVSNINPKPSSDKSVSLICGGNSVGSTTCRTGGSCDNMNFTAPSTPGEYTCTFENGSFSPCSIVPTLTVHYPVTCTISSESVSAGTQITFSGTANTNYRVQGNSCGFKINGNWKDDNQNQNLTSGTMTYTVNSTTTFTYECTQGNAPSEYRKCEKTVTVSGGSGVGTITLSGNWADDKTGYSDGTYTVNHSCSNSGYGVYYHCCNGTTIKWGDQTLTCTATACDGSDSDKWSGHEYTIPASSIPASGSTMTISGGKLSKIGCQ